jgi:membrane protease YdiL (CAAX protease family)
VPLETQLARQRLVEPRNLGEGIGALFAFVIVAPLMEELLFRGLLLPGLERRHGAGPAVLVSALLFGLVHLDWSGSLYAFVAGLLLGALRLRVGSLWPCVTLHAAVNSVPLLVPRALWPVPGFNVPSAEVQHIPPALLFGSLAVAAAALAMVERSTRAAA